MWLPTAVEMEELDRSATSSGATTERTLIEVAGREIAQLIQERWPRGPVIGLLGSGHNGADALVALRTLGIRGRDVRGVLCGSGPPRPDVSAGREIPLSEPEDLAELAAGAAVLVDGILGTGASGAPREPQAEVIRTANGLGLPIVAVDGPSGGDLTTGAVPGDCIRAALTISPGWPKLGLLRHPLRARCGELVAVEIGFPPSGELGARAITGRWVRAMLRSRGPRAHKGDAGHLTLVAGQHGMAGAAILAARGALRGGAGIVRLVSTPKNRKILQGAVPEALFTPWDAPEAVREAVEGADALAIGPGLGQDSSRRALLERVLDLRDGRPVVLDADGLNLWGSGAEALPRHLDEPALLTPHPGEMARLMERSVAEVTADPPGVAREAADRFGVAVLLKGAPSMIAAPGRPLRVCTTGGPANATGGTGDVLTGISGAYLAAGLSPADAGSAALFLSGLASAASDVPEGHLASDVPGRLPKMRRRVVDLVPGRENAILFMQSDGFPRTDGPVGASGRRERSGPTRGSAGRSR